MAPTSIFFSGRLISVPGSYTTVDATGLETIGLGASGIVALVGTALGGKPWTEVGEGSVKDNLQVATNPQQPFEYFRSGDLKEAAAIAFGPSNDADVPGGAVEIVFVKVNPATASSATFNNTDGAALVLTSADYGFHTTQINVEIGTGTAKGKLVTIVFESTTETFDDVGGDTVFQLQYQATTPADGFTTVTAYVTAAALISLFTRDQTGLDGDVTNQATAGQVMELVSSSASDTAVVVEIYGTDGSDATQREQVTLTGTAAVDTQNTWNSFHGARVVSGTLVGTLTIRQDGAGLTIATIAPAGTSTALEPLSDMNMTGALAYVADAADTSRVTVVGLSASGTVQTEVVQLNGTTSVPGTATWSRIDYLALGELPAARTLTVSGEAFNANFAGLDTIQKLADNINGKLGWTFTIVVSNPSTYDPANLDYVATPGADVKNPATGSFGDDLYQIINTLNTESALVTAARASGGTDAPDNTTAPVYLSGGHEGSSTPGQEAVPTATSTDWQGAFDLLKKVFVNTIVPLTGDPAVHAIADAHAAYMGGVGRMERDVCVGLQNAAQTDVPTKTELKSQIVNLNSRHVRAIAQTIDRFNTDLDQETFQPPFAAAMLAGMQAGSPVGTSLTHKYANCLKIEQDSSWNPQDDAEELIKAGLVMLETIDGVGRRVVRNITTHLSTSNLAYTEASVNEATNHAVYNFRTTMEVMVGKSGFAGSVAAADGIAINILGLLVGVSLVTWRSLTIDLILDVLEVSVEIAPVLPINFVQTTVHLVSVPQSAAAAA